MSNSKTICGKIIQIYLKKTQKTGDKYLFLKLQGKGGERTVVFVFGSKECWGELARNGSFYDFEISKSQKGNWTLLNWKRKEDIAVQVGQWKNQPSNFYEWRERNQKTKAIV